MKNAILCLALLFSVCLAPHRAAALTNTCTNAQDELASGKLGAARSLAEIFDIKKEFPGCAGGGLSEEISDAVVVRLAGHWNQSIVELYQRNADAVFVAFVLQHIDATTSEADLKQVIGHASSSCPVQSKAICGRVKEAAKAALSDL
ncbi:hypothetical protein [Phenylobacterium montanum]|uniref:Uncharacterized protein n=1 Tax=Phenylobacterium montanum TaxID=2823693 RepID=A0A975G374_9CAUL|nr:hypothetical protein [Caulobacter sp. S6]QUD89856.1 hypothetical protein KCG34_08295 [Caulobacter sp. S6]